MWSIHHDPKQWDKPDLFNPGTIPPTTSRTLSEVHLTRLPSFLLYLFRSLYGQPRPASHPLLLPAIWGRTSGLCWRIIGQTGTLPLPVIAVTANEFQDTKRCSAAQFTGTPWSRVTATAFQCCCTTTRKY